MEELDVTRSVRVTKVEPLPKSIMAVASSFGSRVGGDEGGLSSNEDEPLWMELMLDLEIDFLWTFEETHFLGPLILT